ncbi:DNA replication regulator SLD2 [Phlyctema vagabunda]|uniref:DNA replication regulator SLD2 n=1 Tax=Phlyctema vagabunda TaxID=108571 RepID=A0ABR4PSD0_9HELO
MATSTEAANLSAIPTVPIEALKGRLEVLRVELRTWETEFAAANEGRKAARDDIKRNPEIASKYKEYHKGRDVLSGKAKPEVLPQAVGHTPRKRKAEVEQSRSKRQHIEKTPLKSVQPWVVDPYDSPSAIRKLFTPSKKSIGPTPQKDGQVLGLFDLIQEEPTPSKPIEPRPTQGQIQATPRKSKTADGGIGLLLQSRTPSTLTRQYMLDTFATPLKNKQQNGRGGDKTPSSVSKLSFSTPSFLRRDSQRLPMPVVDENEDGPPLSPQMVRVPRKPIVRGLSSMLAGLRKMEDEAADEDLEALHEMENEMANPTKTKSQPVPKKLGGELLPSIQEDILVKDSQSGLPLGGFDDEAMYDSGPEEPTLGRDGQPLKVWKKKGQKRTTRRVKMKPTRAKPQAQAGPLAPDDSEDELAQDDEAVVPETQADETAEFDDARNFDSDTQSEYTASEGGTRYRRPDQSKKAKRITKDGKIKTVARKVNALAHQNFKRLKLRNSGAGGGPAHNSRFRRKR